MCHAKKLKFILRKMRNIQRALGMEARWPNVQQCRGGVGWGQTAGRETS